MIARPFLLRRLRELKAVDDEVEQTLAAAGIVTPADFELAAAEHRPAVSNPVLQRAVHAIQREARPLTLGRAWDVVEAAIPEIQQRCPEIELIEASGGVRRSEPLVHGLVLAGRAADPVRAAECLAAAGPATAVLYRAGGRIILLFEGQEIDVRLGAPGEYGTLLFTTTGPASHVAELLKRGNGRLAASEHDIYEGVGLSFLPPETRDTTDAVARAAAQAVPRLVERADVRGDLHTHTDYSDGRDSLREMVLAAHALGYEYVAITDHSEHAGAARTIRVDQIARQRDEIYRLRHDAPGMTILHGLEVDIMPDGSLDCPDAVLETLDVVLASLHDAAGHDRRRLTKRCLSAIHHPLVSVITHPANQLVGRRGGYDLDYAAVYAAAAETGTALEVDGAPSHLDLSGERAREAVLAGATLVIDSDCHRSPALDRQMRMGVGTARRGWVEPRHVLNTRSLAEVRAFLARKRDR